MQKQSIAIGVLLTGILLGSFFVRIYKNTEIPSGFFADEASINYNAYSILETGKDEFGINFPILFQSFGNFRPGISIYASIPSIFIFGLNEFSSRLTPALVGTFTVFIIYFLGRELFSSSLIGLFSAFFLAISPWHIHFSRIGMENIYLPFFICIGLFLFLKGVRKNKNYLIALSFISFGLALYTYVPAYFLIPLFIIIITFVYWKNILPIWKPYLIGLICFFIIAAPVIMGIRQGKTLARFKDLNSTQHHSANDILFAMKNTYIDHFSIDFLFAKGDIGFKNHFISRFSVGEVGELYWFQLPLILLGILYAYVKNIKVFFLLFGLLAIYPLGSTIVPFSDGGGWIQVASATNSSNGVFHLSTFLGLPLSKS